jgi:hypothetical protein
LDAVIVPRFVAPSQIVTVVVPNPVRTESPVNRSITSAPVPKSVNVLATLLPVNVSSRAPPIASFRPVPELRSMWRPGATVCGVVSDRSRVSGEEHPGDGSDTSEHGRHRQAGRDPLAD